MANVRLAVESDTRRLVKMGRAMQQESPRFSRLGYSPSKAWNLITHLIANKDAIVLVSEVDGDIVGMLLGYVSEQFFSSALTASELVVYVKPESRGGSSAARMIRAFEEWAIGRGVKEIQLGVSTEVDAPRTVGFYGRLGYVSSGNTLIKRCA